MSQLKNRTLPQVGYFIKEGLASIRLHGLMSFAAVTVIGRLLSGVHWLTDIIGAVLLSAALVTLYAAALSLFEKHKER